MNLLPALKVFFLLLKSKEWYVIGFLPNEKVFIDANCKIDKMTSCTENYINDSLEQEYILNQAKDILNK